MSDLKLCIDCIHFVRSDIAAIYHKCARYGAPDYVVGGIKPEYADVCRAIHGACGHEGKGWESQEVRDYQEVRDHEQR